MPAQTQGKRYKMRVVTLKQAKQAVTSVDRVNKYLLYKQMLKRLKHSRTQIDYAYNKSRAYAERNGLKHTQTVIDRPKPGVTVINPSNGVKREKCTEHHYSTRVPFKWELNDTNDANAQRFTKTEIGVFIVGDTPYALKTPVTHIVYADGAKRYKARILGRTYTLDRVNASECPELAQTSLNYGVSIYRVNE